MTENVYQPERGIAKSPTGIQGLDEITRGGLPTGRPTLICGSAGCGKTLFAMEFLVRGATMYNEPGLFVAFEEMPEELAANVASLGFDLVKLEEEGKLMLDHVHIDTAEIEQSGEYDLEGLFVRLNYQIDAIGAKRVVLDTLETLFNNLKDETLLRSELVRLFRWLKQKGVTAVITGERGDGSLTRHGLEEYISDCVILLDNRVIDQVSTRRMRIVKYRGTAHGANEYPFLIDHKGFTVLPVTSLDLIHDVSNEQISTGVPRLDHMVGGGYYRGSSVLISGGAGTGKTTLLSHVLAAACERGERGIFFSFEESPPQIIRNAGNIGIDLKRHVDNGQLIIKAARPQLYGLELHLAMLHRMVAEFQPTVVAVDPVTSLMAAGTHFDASLALLRLIDFLKHSDVTSVMSSLTHGGEHAEATEAKISSLMDTWLLLRNIENFGERNRGLYVMKSRGTGHSNQIREFRITPQGVDLVDVYVGTDGVLAGSARMAQIEREAMAERQRSEEMEIKQRELDRKRRALEAQIDVLRAEFEAEELSLQRVQKFEIAEATSRKSLRTGLAHARRADAHKENGS